jgi:hypothetical protein
MQLSCAAYVQTNLCFASGWQGRTVLLRALDLFAKTGSDLDAKGRWPNWCAGCLNDHHFSILLQNNPNEMTSETSGCIEIPQSGALTYILFPVNLAFSNLANKLGSLWNRLAFSRLGRVDKRSIVLNKIGYHINPHENGWAVMAGGVKGVCPSKHMAKASIEDGTENQSSKTAPDDFWLRKSRDHLAHSTQDTRQHVVAPDDILL